METVTRSPSWLEAHRNGAAVAAAVTANALWGTSFLLGKMALVELSAMQVILGRFIIASVILLPVAARRWKKLQAGDAGLFALSGFLMVPVMMVLQFEGLNRTSATSAALIIGAIPVLLAVAAVLVDRERLGPRGWMAVLLSTLGAFILAGTPGAERTLLGDGLVLASAFAAVAWVLTTRRLLHRYGTMMTTALSIAVGTAWLLPIVLVTDGIPTGALSGETWFALVSLGVLCSATTYTLWNWALKSTSASRLAPFVNLEPLVGAALGLLVLREHLSSGLLIGGLLILGSAFLASFSARAD